MKKFLKSVATLAALGLPLVAVGQTALTKTTLVGSVTAGQPTIQVASATGIVPPSPLGGPAQTPGLNTVLFVDSEEMYIESMSGTTLYVQRGAGGTKQSAHNANAAVWVGPPAAFLASDPVGPCTAGITYNPTVVTSSAYRTSPHYWNCITLSTGDSLWEPVLTTGAITPVATGASIGTSGQTFTVKGLVTGEPITIVSAPASTSLCPLSGAAVTAADTVTLYFTTLTAAACTPASGTYLISTTRFSL